eukprot:gene1279-2721_t
MWTDVDGCGGGCGRRGYVRLPAASAKRNGARMSVCARRPTTSGMAKGEGGAVATGDGRRPIPMKEMFTVFTLKSLDFILADTAKKKKQNRKLREACEEARKMLRAHHKSNLTELQRWGVPPEGFRQTLEDVVHLWMPLKLAALSTVQVPAAPLSPSLSPRRAGSHTRTRDRISLQPCVVAALQCLQKLFSYGFIQGWHCSDLALIESTIAAGGTQAADLLRQTAAPTKGAGHGATDLAKLAPLVVDVICEAACSPHASHDVLIAVISALSTAMVTDSCGVSSITLLISYQMVYHCFLLSASEIVAATAVATLENVLMARGQAMASLPETPEDAGPIAPSRDYGSAWNSLCVNSSGGGAKGRVLIPGMP